MPHIRKLTAEEIRRIEHNECQYQIQVPRTSVYERARMGMRSSFDESHRATRAAPRIGDIVSFREEPALVEQQGIVLHVHEVNDGWVAALIRSDIGQRWVSAQLIGATIGRPRGISRIDQPLRRTHGWFVRIYDQGKPIVARMFSDGKYGNVGRALEAAMEFYQSYDQVEKQRQVNGDHN